MTRNSFILFTVIVAGLFVSCKPIYKCGEPKPEKKLFLPKNIITVINERDSLCNTLSVREVEILDMKDIVQTQKTNISKLQTEKLELTTQYNDLMNEKLSQA